MPSDIVSTSGNTIRPVHMRKKDFYLISRFFGGLNKSELLTVNK